MICITFLCPLTNELELQREKRYLLFLLLFLHFHSFFSFSPVPLFHLLYYLFCLYSPFLSSTVSSVSILPFSGRWHKTTYKGWLVIKPQNNQKYLLTCEPNEDSNQPAPLRSLIGVFVFCIKKHNILGYPRCAQWRFWSDCNGTGWSAGGTCLKVLFLMLRYSRSW